MITEMIRDWWLRRLGWRSGRSTASQRLHHLRRESRRQRQTASARHRRLDGNRGHHWSTEATELVPTLRPLMTYGQQLGYRVVLHGSP
ncbi:hypothetical protein EDC02_5364 [Micromonospora sp. Llam0]|uniref:hypothetical protein n=1 Tax=Micromonospora sp. Llam0 TaxID=2485143 RepID=UPI000FBC75A3|nr:hypothetical protein [Micromonospora sp. Llam0]ROO63342.1 hypothetical protein EDC02_5364 [Micromonospora sp. Llam0]